MLNEWRPTRRKLYMKFRGKDESEWHQVAAVPLGMAFAPPEIVRTDDEPE